MDTSTLSPPPLEWPNVVADEGTEEVSTHQPISEQTQDDIVHGLQLTGVFLSHPVPPAGLDDWVLTGNRRERRTDIFPLEEALFLPSNQWVGDREACMGQFSAWCGHRCLCSPTPPLPHLSPAIA
jgi:hypothetical protein